MASEPDVSVVVIVYNDGRRIERAVRSVLNQTLRNCEVLVVDDASTDETPEAIRRLVAAAPDRVRSFRLAENSGGCGRPRNVGIEAARGRYVMFLDSDDTLDRNACRNLLLALEAADADMAVGRSVRIIVGAGTEAVWKAKLVARRVLYQSLSEEPGLLHDLLSTNKMYRRAFLNAQRLRFPEDRLYEDMLFATHAYLTANRIAIIPHRVYNWYVERKAPNASISNRPTDLRNMVDRISINRDMDELLSKYGTPQLQLTKDLRFIEHDLGVHLGELPGEDEAHQKRLVDAAAPYLADLDPRAFTATAYQMHAMAAYLLGRGDVDGVRSTMEWSVQAKRSRQLTTDLVERDGRIYWCDRHLDDDVGREVLDVTALGLHDRPLGRLHLGTRITEVTGTADRVTLLGELVNPLGRIKAGGRLDAVLQLGDRRRGRRKFSIPVRVRHGDRRLRWEATFDPRKVLRPVGLLDVTWSVRLRLTTADEVVDLLVFASPQVRERLSLPISPRLGRLTADRLRAYPTASGHLAFRLAAHEPAARAAAVVLDGLRSTTALRSVWTRGRQLAQATREYANRRETKVAVYDRVLTRLPVRPHSVVFESQQGREYAGNPRAVYEELRRSSPDHHVTWVYSRTPDGFPQDARIVKRDSWAYYRAVARAQFWVDDRGFPPYLGKRGGTTYIQAWHESPYERLGFHDPATNRLTAQQQQPLRQAVERYDANLVRSDYEMRTLVPAFRVKAELLPIGHPRNDVLVRGGDAERTAAVRRQLKLAGSRVILYAPVVAPGAGRRGAYQVPFDLIRFVERYGDQFVLVVRPPVNTQLTVPPSVRATVRDATGVTDVPALLLASEVLVTDHSPLMFDYALLDRPMVFHQSANLDGPPAAHRAYFDLAEVAPGPLTQDDDDLFAALDELPDLGTRYAEARRRFVADCAGYDTGHAAEAVVTRFFAPGGQRG